MARLGAAARRRRQAGGPQAIGRPSLSLTGYAILRALVFARARHRCEGCGAAQPIQLEHAKPRSAGGADSWDNCWGTCVACHRQKESPYGSRSGRLLVRPLGDGRFCFRVVRGTKYEYQVVRERQGGRLATEEERVILAGLM